LTLRSVLVLSGLLTSAAAAAWLAARRPRLSAASATLVATLGAVPLAALLAPPLGGPDPSVPPGGLAYVATWLYAILVVATAIALGCRVEIPAAIRRARSRLRGVSAVLWRRTVGWRPGMLLLSAALALVAVVLPGSGGSTAGVWVRVLADGPAGAAPPPAQLRFGPGAADVVGMRWQPYERTTVAIVPSAQTPPVRVTAVEDDRGSVSLETLHVAGGTKETSAIVVKRAGALLRWSGGSGGSASRSPRAKGTSGCSGWIAG
jgi:hypothetical protein